MILQIRGEAWKSHDTIGILCIFLFTSVPLQQKSLGLFDLFKCPLWKVGDDQFPWVGCKPKQRHPWDVYDLPWVMIVGETWDVYVNAASRSSETEHTLTSFINISSLHHTYVLLVHTRDLKLAAQGSVQLLEVFCVVLSVHPHSV